MEKPGSSLDVFMVHNCTEQFAFATFDGKLRVLIADQPQKFALIFTISEVPPVALLRGGSKVKDATIHIHQEVVLFQWLHLFDVTATGLPVFSILTFTIAPHSPKLSESCASCPLLWHILRRLLVSPCAHDSPFLSSHLSTILLSPHQYLKRRTRVSKCYSTQVRLEMGREQISSGLFSLHPFFLSKTLILNLFVSPSSRIIALFSWRLSNTDTRFNWALLRFTGPPVASCSLPAPRQFFQ